MPMRSLSTSVVGDPEKALGPDHPDVGRSLDNFAAFYNDQGRYADAEPLFKRSLDIQPFHKALLTGKTTHAAWRSKPSFYAVSTEDRTINPDLERFMAKRMGAKTIEVKASHLS